MRSAVMRTILTAGGGLPLLAYDSDGSRGGIRSQRARNKPIAGGWFATVLRLTSRSSRVPAVLMSTFLSNSKSGLGYQHPAGEPSPMDVGEKKKKRKKKKKKKAEQ